MPFDSLPSKPFPSSPLPYTQDIELLTRARALIEKGWIKGTYARNVAGRKVSSLSPEAESFCALGALRRAAFDMHLGRLPWNTDAFFYLQRQVPQRKIAAYNDSVFRRKGQILALFDNGIAELQKKQEDVLERLSLWS